MLRLVNIVLMFCFISFNCMAQIALNVFQTGTPEKDTSAVSDFVVVNKKKKQKRNKYARVKVKNENVDYNKKIADHLFNDNEKPKEDQVD